MEYHEISAALKRHGYIIDVPLGKGGFATCWKCTRAQGGFEFACKVISHPNEVKTKASVEALQTSYENELSTLKMAYHPNVINIYDSFTDGNSCFLILEYCPFGTVENEVRQSAKGKLSKEHLFKFSSQLIYAINFLHSLGISHNDIKPNNCLIDKDGNLKISDFGMAMHDTNQTNLKQGTMHYMAPELFASGGHDPFATDIWALGVTLYYFWKGKSPFSHAVTQYQLMTEQKCFGKIRQRSNQPFKCTLAKIINSCLKIDASSRSNIMQINKMLSSIESQQYEKAMTGHLPKMSPLQPQIREKFHRSTAEIQKLPRLQRPPSKEVISTDSTDKLIIYRGRGSRRNSDGFAIAQTEGKEWLPLAMRNPPISTVDFRKNRNSLKMVKSSYI